MEVINLNIIPTGALPVVHASQYDDGRTFRANLMDGSTVYTLDGTEVLECGVKKPDGNIVTVAVTNTSDSYVEIDTTLQMCACAGDSLAALHITKGAQEIGTLNFILAVERSPLENGIASASEINNLWTQVDGMVSDALATQYDSANVIFDNLPTEGHGIPYAVTSEGIGNAIDNALDMTAEASGAIATFESEYALPLRDLEIEINAVETGDGNPKSPSNPYTISGFTGANIKQFGDNLISGDTYQLGANVVLLGESAGDTYSTYLKATTYTISFTRPTSKTFRLDLTDSNGVQTRIINAGTATSKTFTIETEGFYKLGTYLSGGMTPSDIANVMLVAGSEVKPYKAYTAPTTTAITWNDEAGTVYGGTLDVTSGVLTVTWGGVDLGSLEWTYYNASGNYIFFADLLDGRQYATTGITAELLCSCFKVISQSTGASAVGAGDDKSIGVNSTTGYTYTRLLAKDTDYTTKSAFTTAVTGQKVVYKLATPVTYQLTPTQISAIVGTNNIFTDTNGDTSLEYYTKRGEQTVHISEATAKEVINSATFGTLDTTDKTIVGAVNEVNTGVNNSVRRYTTSWGTTCQTTIGRYQFLVLRGITPYAVWLASTNDINVSNIASNTSASGTGSATLDSIVFTRLSNNNLKVEVASNNAITIIG